MKVGIWLNEHINKELGGGFSYTDKLIKLIDEYSFSKDVEIVFITKESNIRFYKKEVINLEYYSTKLKTSLKQDVKKFIINKISYLKFIKKNADNRAQAKQVNEYYKFQLLKEGVSVIFYPIQTQCYVADFPFIATNWDIGHLSMFAFPEVTHSRIFENRDDWYQKKLRKALAIFVESDTGKEELTTYLNINPARIKVFPIFPGAVIMQKVAIEKQIRILKKFDINKEEYFFYPAQFWAHKNHYNLILAFKELVKTKPNAKLVFTGSDKGNLKYIKHIITKYKLSNNVLHLGFLGLEEIYVLYKNAISLVFPSFLGPTNMPLLEAQALGCPVLCSDLNGHKLQLGDGALYFDPLKQESIYSTLLKVMDDEVRNFILERAKENLNNSKLKDSDIMKSFESNLMEISKYRNCWGSD